MFTQNPRRGEEPEGPIGTRSRTQQSRHRDQQVKEGLFAGDDHKGCSESRAPLLMRAMLAEGWPLRRGV